jgi:hypothetical protein
MSSEPREESSPTQQSESQPNPFSAADVAAILREQNWASDLSEAQLAWCARAAIFLGPQSETREALTDLLSLIFHYDAHEILQRVDSHSVLARYGARDVVRRIAHHLLEGPALNSERLKEIVNEIKATSDLRSRDLFHPIRLALAGRAGEGELDRVVLLLDEAAASNFEPPVKSARTRILEFCAALD